MGLSQLKETQMNPHDQFCPNLKCPARGKIGAENIHVHSRKEKRYRCGHCGKTFSETHGTALYGLKHEHKLFETVTTLLAYGCPLQAVVKAFALDERTVTSWLQRSGTHCQQVHEAVMSTAKLELGQVQADEIKVKVQGGSVWMALAEAVPYRLWLGGVVSVKRDLDLIRRLVALVVAVALCRPLLLAVDGFASYVRAFQEGFRSPLPSRGQGRPRLRPWDEIAIVQVVKHRSAATLTIQRRIVQGSSAFVERLLRATQGGGQINTAYIERLNATFRQRLASLTRRSRALARRPQTLAAGMFLIGTVYNFCTYHDSLALELLLSPRRRRWLRRTPAIAAGLTDHCWTVAELLRFKIPPSAYIPPKRRGRPPKAALA